MQRETNGNGANNGSDHRNGGHRWLACALLALTPLWAGAQMYRSVGPDGRVSFSDTPPTQDGARQTQQLGKAATARRSSGELDTFMRNATLGAAIKLTVLAGVVDRMTFLCSTQDSAVADPVRQARLRWQENHAPLLEVKDRILADLLPPERRDTVNGPQTQAELDRVAGPLAEANPDEKTAFCRRMPQQIASSAMNLYNSPDVVKLFTSYQR